VPNGAEPARAEELDPQANLAGAGRTAQHDGIAVRPLQERTELRHLAVAVDERPPTDEDVVSGRR
jgi:hypothetical protein